MDLRAGVETAILDHQDGSYRLRRTQHSDKTGLGSLTPSGHQKSPGSLTWVIMWEMHELLYFLNFVIKSLAYILFTQNLYLENGALEFCDLKKCWLSVGRWALRSDTAVLVIYAYENLEGNPYLLISGSRQNVGEIQNISVLAPCHFQQSYL